MHIEESIFCFIVCQPLKKFQLKGYNCLNVVMYQYKTFNKYFLGCNVANKLLNILTIRYKCWDNYRN